MDEFYDLLLFHLTLTCMRKEQEYKCYFKYNNEKGNQANVILYYKQKTVSSLLSFSKTKMYKNNNRFPAPTIALHFLL